MSLLEGSQYLWGSDYLFLRDEFEDAQPAKFSAEVKKLLITFGGSDPAGYSLRILKLILPYCREKSISINLVTGSGFKLMKELLAFLKEQNYDLLQHHTSLSTMSTLMQNANAALCSNGRTVYELAHMNVPSIVLSQHERERAHSFACKENGFLPLGIRTSLPGIWKSGD